MVDNIVPGGKEGAAETADRRAAGQYVNAFEKLRDPSHHRALSLEEWIDAFEQAGLTLLHQETAGKAIEFVPWAERMGCAPATIGRLRRMLLEATGAAKEFLNPEEVNGELVFYLTEAILIGRKGD